MRRLITTIMIGAMTLAACSGDSIDTVTSQLDSTTDASVADQVEQNAVDLAADVELQMDTLTSEIQASQAADEVQSAWNDIQTEVTAAIASMQTDGTITTDGIEDALDQFQTTLDEAGDEIAPDVRSAWESLRSSIEEMMA